MDTKAAFEKWYLEQQDPEAYLASDESGYFDDTVQMEWGVWSQAWTASRAAIECELPDPDMWGDEQSVQEYSEMTEQSLQAIGIRIKGETE